MSEVIQGDTVERDYEVESGIVMLNIIVGEGQAGASVVWLDNQVIAKGDLGPVTLGPGAILTGRVLGIRTIALDINPMTNRTAVTYILTGGATELDVTLTKDAPQDGAAVPYAARFPLVAKGANV